MFKKFLERIWYKTRIFIGTEEEAKDFGSWFVMTGVKVEEQYEVLTLTPSDDHLWVFKVRMDVIERLMYYLDYKETNKQTWAVI